MKPCAKDNATHEQQYSAWLSLITAFYRPTELQTTTRFRDAAGEQLEENHSSRAAESLKQDELSEVSEKTEINGQQMPVGHWSQGCGRSNPHLSNFFGLHHSADTRLVLDNALIPASKENTNESKGASERI